VRERFEIAELAVGGAIYGVLAWRIIANIADGRWETLLAMALVFALYIGVFWLLGRVLRAYVRALHRRWPERYKDPERLLNPVGQLSIRWQWIVLTVLALLGTVREMAESEGNVTVFLAVLDFTMAGVVTWFLLGALGRPGRLAVTGALAGLLGSAVAAFAFLALTGGDPGDIVPPVAVRWALYGLAAGLGLGMLRALRPAVRLAIGLAAGIIAAGLLTQRAEVTFVWPYQICLAAGWSLVLGLNRTAAAALSSP
jgi:hypothetical protein